MLAWCKHALFSLPYRSCSQALFPIALGDGHELQTDVDRNPRHKRGIPELLGSSPAQSRVLAAAAMVSPCLLALLLG